MDKLIDLIECIAKFDSTETDEVKARYFDVIQKEAKELVNKNESLKCVNLCFYSKDDLREHIEKNIPFAIKATKTSKRPLVQPFTSLNAQITVIDVMVECLLSGD